MLKNNFLMNMISVQTAIIFWQKKAKSGGSVLAEINTGVIYKLAAIFDLIALLLCKPKTCTYTEGLPQSKQAL